MSDKKNKDTQTNLGQLMIRAFYWLDVGLQGNLQKRGGPEITHSQSVIMMLIGEGVRRPSAIAERLGITRQAVHQSLREMIEVGIVDLVSDPNDGRAKIARFSRKGAPIHRKAKKIMDQLEAELCERIGKRQVASLRASLESDWGDPAIFD